MILKGGIVMVQFDPNWASNSSNQHLVPNTYLKAWSNNNTDVYYIEKNEMNIDFKQKNFQKNTKRLTTVKEFYTRNVYTSFDEADDLEKIFLPLKSKKYSVIYNKKEIGSFEELKKEFHDFDSWEIYKPKNVLISNKEKAKLKKEIEEVKIRDIEEAWNRMFENSWPNTREAVEEAVKLNHGAAIINAVKREELIKFMVAIEWRTFPPHPEILRQFNKLINILGIEKTLNEPVEKEEEYLSIVSTRGEYYLHEIILKNFYKFFHNKGPIFVAYTHIYKNMDIELLIPEPGFEFITSDNPINTFTNSNNEIEYIFPITPVLACAVRNNRNDLDIEKYRVTTYSKDKVFTLNENTKNSCYRGYILRQPNLKVYFK